MQYQCKNCGTPVRVDGFCSHHCKVDYKERMEDEVKDADFVSEERGRDDH